MSAQVLQLIVNGVVAGTILAVPAIGLSTIFAVLRFANFALAGHMAIGAFAGYVANAWLGLPAYVAILAAFAAAGIVGIVSDHFGLRPLRNYGALTLAIASIALNLVLENVLRFGFGNRPRDYAIKLVRDWTFGPIRIGPQQLENLAIAVAAMALIFLFLALTTTGKAMRAVADNPILADIKGIDPDRMARFANFIGMGLGGVGGMLVGLDTSVDPLVGFRALLSVFAAAVVGGLGSIPGAAIGGLFIGLAEELSLLALPASYKTAVGFLAILIMLTLRPRGILGERGL
ncbi:MAG: branched-chain amino acid ABC transporter permease [Proteobacteria bacterium]|nr:branched-chain amino acid ABC transporter permease [Pseudomonadota bacterium]MBI3499805.1 branched-chain amino acid ABC transporter permease [Pseudomonadota bacterium]